MDQAQIEANVTLEKALRRANLLTAASKVSQNISQIMDIDELLPKTVDIICEAYNFYYAGVFLIDNEGEFAVLRAGYGEPGRIMMENNHKLAVGGNSMIGACTSLNEARISLDVDTEKVWYPNPVLPETRSEMALPLAVGNRMIGAVTVQSVEAAAFSDEDITSLQAMANQLAIALENARQRRELEETHLELVQAKTYEAIATATGDAIHWIGNKAEPIRSSVARTQHDIQLLIASIVDILDKGQISDEVKNQALIQLIAKEAVDIKQSNATIAKDVKKINALPLKKLEKRLSLDSTMEDLQIIDDAAVLIMKVKEDLIGPAKEQAPRAVMIDDVVRDAVNGLDIAEGIVTINSKDKLPMVLVDPIQLNRIIVNLVNNALEAIKDQEQPQINITLRPADSADEAVKIEVTDNGPGIAQDRLDKVWITFHTTKGVKGHSGLGLSACRLILEQIGGHISVSSTEGQGATFTSTIPAYKGKEIDAKGEAGKGKILLVDDDDIWRSFAKTALGAAGYKVTISGNNYNMQNYNQYDLILVDDILANIDSLDIYSHIKTAGAIAKTVAVTSNPRVERTKERMLLGIHNLLPKPYTTISLLSEVKSTLRSIS